MGTVPSLKLVHPILNVFYRWRLARFKDLFQCEQGNVLQRLARNHVGEGQLGLYPAPPEPEHVWLRKADRAQANEATVFILKELLQGIDIRANDSDDAATSFEDALKSFSPTEVLSNQQERFESIAERGDYEEVLRVFNEKGFAKSVGHFMGVNDRDYCGKVVTMLRESDGDEIREAMASYVPARDCFGL